MWGQKEDNDQSLSRNATHQMNQSAATAQGFNNLQVQYTHYSSGFTEKSTELDLKSCSIHYIGHETIFSANLLTDTDKTKHNYK